MKLGEGATPGHPHRTMRCGMCEHQWTREKCPSCGSDEIESVLAPLLVEAREALAMFTSVKDLSALNDAPGYFEVAISKARALLAKLDTEEVL